MDAAVARDRDLSRLAEAPYDVAILGGGVSGAAVFRELRARGHRALLVDRGDFASGTSQASGMLVWGGLLYLRRLELRTVRALSLERDALLSAAARDVRLAPFRYLALKHGGRSPWLVRCALELYWWLGSRRRARPRWTSRVPSLVRGARFRGALTYEEGALERSDARLVLDWILDSEDEHRAALNHVEATGARRERGLWHLDLEDRRSPARATVKARVIVNAAGVWADALAARFGVETHHKHVLSKGVYLGLARPPELAEFLAFEMGAHGDTQTFTPWGPVALWGPTETPLESLDGAFEPNVEDVRFLLDQARRNLAQPIDVGDVVSVRTGVRPLAVERAYSKDVYPLDLSRKHVVDVDRARAALTLYGGKITSAGAFAREAADVIERDVPGRFARTMTPPETPRETPSATPPETLRFPGLEAPLLDPAYARDRERCLTLVDYIRRRTNVAQWVPRWGLGASDAREPDLRAIAEVLHSAAPDGADTAAADLAEVRRLAARQDALLAAAD